MATVFAKETGFLDAHILGDSSPKIKIRTVRIIIWTVKIRLTGIDEDAANSNARETAIIEAATLTTVLPTNTFTSSRLGCSSNCSRYLSIRGLLSIINFRRFLSSENNDTSEPEKNAEQKMNINNSINL
jgi:hypothetical protein